MQGTARNATLAPAPAGASNSHVALGAGLLPGGIIATQLVLLAIRAMSNDLQQG